MIFTGKDGLKEVAKKDGSWNWVLVGPNPETLPLVGGGAGSVKEMHDCLAKQELEADGEQQFANFYGLLRASFGQGRMARTKYVFVQASRVDEREEKEAECGEDAPKAKTMSAVRHGRAMSQLGAMEKALTGFCHFTAKVTVTRVEDLSIDNVIEKVKKVSTADADMITADGFNEALGEFLKLHPLAMAAPEVVAETEDDKALTAACVAEIFATECAPAAEAQQAEPEQEQVLDETTVHPFPMDEARAESGLSDSEDEKEEEEAPAADELAATKEEETPPVYKKGDLLFVFSHALKQWLDDGVVMTCLVEAGERDGLWRPEGSIEVHYNNRRQFKWVTPVQVKECLRPSERPAPPPMLQGEMRKETHNFFTQWHVRYFELCKGYLQWWMTAEDARQGMVPKGSLSLTSLEMSVQGTVILLRTSSSKRMIYAFDATTAESVKKWSEMMKLHEEHCRNTMEYLAKHASEVECARRASKLPDLEAQEKLTGLVAARKRRASLNAAQPAAMGAAGAVANAIAMS